MIELILIIFIVGIVAAIILAPIIEEKMWNYNGKKGDDDE